jgi:hypothetical protein
MTILQTQVGIPAAAPSANPSVSSGRNGEVITADLHGKKYTAAYNGKLYIASTSVAGVAPGTALSTTPPMCLWNPPGSGVNLEIHRAWLGYVSGTLGAGSIVWAWGPQNTNPSTGTALVPVGSPVGNLATGAGKAFQGSTVAQTPVIVRPAWTLGAFLATTAGINPPLVDEVDGELVLAPGNFLCLQGVTAAGSTPLCLFGLTWAEIQI